MEGKESKGMEWLSREKARMPRSEERGGMALCMLRLITCNSKWLFL